MTAIDISQIHHAAKLLREGKLVALPTETVYGLGAHARNPQAINHIFLAKARPFTHPLILHLATAASLSDWACDIPKEAVMLAKAFWPGPLTLILKKQPHVNALLTGGQATVGVRVPAHPVAQALLQALGDGIVAPSANRFGCLSPTTAEAVREELGDKVDYVLEGGTCEVGIESTILDLSREQPVILRPGMITRTQIEKTIHQSVTISQEHAPRAPGMDVAHYAPNTPLTMVASTKIAAFLDRLAPLDLPLAFLVHQPPAIYRKGVEWVVMGNHPRQYAHDLYVTLRALDKQGFKKIIVESVPEEADWDAIRDRLGRAVASF